MYMILFDVNSTNDPKASHILYINLYSQKNQVEMCCLNALYFLKSSLTKFGILFN